MIFVGVVTCWVMSLRALQACLGQNWLTSVFFWTLLAMISCMGIVYRIGIINQLGEKRRHFELSGHFTYPVWQRSACGQRGLDNWGCTVPGSIHMTLCLSVSKCKEEYSEIWCVHVQHAWFQHLFFIDPHTHSLSHPSSLSLSLSFSPPPPFLMIPSTT